MRKLYWPKSLYLSKIRLIGLGLIIFICLIFLYLKIVPGGHIVYQKDYSQRLNFGQGFIYNFTPQERVEMEKGRLPKIKGDPVYFSVFTPRTFNKAKLSISYYRHLDQEVPIIEAGVLADNVIWRYDLKPIENRILDNLKSFWLSLDDKPLVLQADNYYENSEEFFNDLSENNLKNCPGGVLECLAVYNYDLNLDLKPIFSNYEEPITIDMPLRGTHSLYVYTEKSKLNLNLDFVDLNLDKDSDNISLILSRNGQVIASETLEDENLSLDNEVEEVKSLSLDMPGISPGVYKLEIKISDDVVIKKIESSSNRLVFSSRLWPVSNPDSIKVYTDANYLFLKALGPASLQDFSFANKSYSLDVPYSKQEFFLDKPRAINEIVIEKDDVILENSGVFALSKDTLFNPRLKKVDVYFKPCEEVKYIIADYYPPSLDEKGLFTQSIELDMSHVYREKGRYNFALSLPNLKNDSSNYLEVKDVKIEFLGRTIWQKIFNR